VSCDGRYLIASKRVARGEVPVRHILFYGVSGSDTGFLLLEHVDGHEDDELGVMCSTARSISYPTAVLSTSRDTCANGTRTDPRLGCSMPRAYE